MIVDRMGVVKLLENAKVASFVSITMIATGTGTILDWVPDDIGKLSILIGIVLSCVLIFTHIRKSNLQSEKTKLEIERLKDD